MSATTTVGQKVKDSILVNRGTSYATIVPEYYKNPKTATPDTGSAGSTGSAGYVQNSSSALFDVAVVSQVYRYNFHYIEIPVLAHWQITKGRRLPAVALEGGLSIAQLMTVHAVHYEGIKGVYYTDNSLINKTQLNLMMSVSIGLFQRTKHPLWIGPDFRYALTGLVKKDVSTGQYLWSSGISIKMLLGKF